MEKKIWFRRKRYGWGWTPSTWEGWAVILVWAILFVFLMPKMDHEWSKTLLLVIISVGLLISVCYKKGESPRWQWGKDNDEMKK